MTRGRGLAGEYYDSPSYEGQVVSACVCVCSADLKFPEVLLEVQVFCTWTD
jgi:hypothetical protein